MGNVKPVLFSLVLLVPAGVFAEPTVREVEWEPACGGAVIEVTEDKGKTLRIVAEAEHSASKRSWDIHFGPDGPVSAEYREYRVDRFLKGDHAGEIKGYTLIRSESLKAKAGKFTIKDAKLAEDLKDVMGR